MLIISCATHAILAAVPSAGPTPDFDQLEGVLMELPRFVAIRHMLGDAGFDAAHHHSLLRDYHGVLSTLPPEHGRPAKDPKALPTDKYRRLMKTRFNAKAFRSAMLVYAGLLKNDGCHLCRL